MIYFFIALSFGVVIISLANVFFFTKIKNVLLLILAFGLFILSIFEYFIPFLPLIWPFLVFTSIFLLCDFLLLFFELKIKKLYSNFYSQINTFTIVINSNFKIKHFSLGLLNILFDRHDLGKNLFKVFQKNIRVISIFDDEKNKDFVKTFMLSFNLLPKPVDILFACFDLKGNKMKITMKIDAKNKSVFYLIHGEVTALDNTINYVAKEGDEFIDVITNDFEYTKENKMIHDLKTDSLFLSQSLATLLGFHNQTISYKEFFALIDDFDKENRNTGIINLNSQYPNYELTYKMKIRGEYRVVSEKGVKILGLSPKILCYILLVSTYHFEKTNHNVLDTLAVKEDLINAVVNLISKDRTFFLVSFSPYNIKSINERHGRDTGNLALSQVITKFINVFETKIFRIEGLLFVAILSDSHLLHILSSDAKNYYYEDMTFGASRIRVCVKAGISIYPYDTQKKNPTLLINNSIKALKKAIDDDVAFVEYKDIEPNNE